jgi:hypothetical protein
LSPLPSLLPKLPLPSLLPATLIAVIIALAAPALPLPSLSSTSLVAITITYIFAFAVAITHVTVDCPAPLSPLLLPPSSSPSSSHATLVANAMARAAFALFVSHCPH